MTGHETWVSEAARRLWECEGTPDGRDLELWLWAERWVLHEAACRKDLARRSLSFPSSSPRRLDAGKDVS